MSADFDVAVVGSGFAGSLFAMACRRIGRSVVLIERGSHPRFAIGESSSPIANLLLEDLCRRYDLPRVAPLASWGTWRRAHPEVGCGLKRGFTFYGHRTEKAFFRDPERRDQLLVAASPHDEVADTHWYRADVDHFLVREAEREGVAFLDRTRLDGCAPGPSAVRLEGERLGRSVSITARFVADASGPRGFLHRALGLPEAAFRGLPANAGLFTHFEGVRRTDDLPDFATGGTPPYPPDDAALHHVFDGGWIWVLRFGSGITSAGVATQPRLAESLRLSEGAAAWSRLLSRLPSVARQFEEARPVRPFVHAPVLPFRSAVVAGERWALLPSAAAFVDPLLSTGIPLALLGIERLARSLDREWERPGFAPALEAYGAATLREADAAALLVAALFANLSDFELFAKLSLLYFASASFAEAARRLGSERFGRSFLGVDDPPFAGALRRIASSAIARSRGESLDRARTQILEEIDEAIAPLDVAGLRDRSRRNWHPVEAEPLLDGASKLGVGKDRIEAMLRETGFFAEPAAARSG